MGSTNLNIRTDKNVKEAAEKIFAELGINMTAAVNIFLRQVIRENGIPFSLKLNTEDKTNSFGVIERKESVNEFIK